MNDLMRLLGLARKIRLALEKVAIENGYNDDLGGLCYDATLILSEIASQSNIEVELAQGYGHWFVLYNDMIVDITATQFGVKEKVMVISTSEVHHIGNRWTLLKKMKYPPQYPPEHPHIIDMVKNEISNMLKE
jgi:hypothetical protein